VRAKHTHLLLPVTSSDIHGSRSVQSAAGLHALVARGGGHQTQAQAVGHDRHGAESHHAARDGRAQGDAVAGEQRPGCQWDADQVIGQGPGEVLPDVAQRPPAELQCLSVRRQRASAAACSGLSHEHGT